MRNLRAYAYESGAVAELQSRIINRPDVQGLGVRYDDYWFYLWSLYCQVGYERFDQIEAAELASGYGSGTSFPALTPPGLPTPAPPSPATVDPSWSCRSWDKWVARSKRRGEDPFVVEVRIASDSHSARRYDFRESHTDSLSDIFRLPLNIEVVNGPPTRLQAGTAERIWQGKPDEFGSVGGFILLDGREGLCVTTAAHVAPEPYCGVFVGQSAAPPSRGSCIYSSMEYGAGCVDETAVFALEEVMPDGQLEHRLAGHARIHELEIGDLEGRVQLGVNGAVSARADLVAYQYVKYRHLWHHGKSIRIDDGFEVRRDVVSLFGSRKGSTTCAGDSGAWLYRDEPSGRAWVGTVVGGDGTSTVATFAQNTLESLRLRGRMQILSLPGLLAGGVPGATWGDERDYLPDYARSGGIRAKLKQWRHGGRTP